MTYQQLQQQFKIQGRSIYIDPEYRELEKDINSFDFPFINLSKAESIRYLYKLGKSVKEIQQLLNIKYSSQIYSTLK